MPISAVSEKLQISAKNCNGNSQAIQLCCGNEKRRWDEKNVRDSSRVLLSLTRQVRSRQRSPLRKKTKPKVFVIKGHLNELPGDTWLGLPTYTLRKGNCGEMHSNHCALHLKVSATAWNGTAGSDQRGHFSGEFAKLQKCLHYTKCQIDTHNVKW